MLHAPELCAFERTYRTEGPFVAAVLGRLAVPSEAVHDAVQDVFVAAYRRWPDFDTARPVRPWLTAFAHRVAFRYRRSQARRDRKRAALRHILPRAERSGAQRADARAFLESFLGTLDEGHRRTFLLSEVEGCTAPEVAHVLGISSEAVYGRVRSVRKRLHRALMDDARQPDARAAALVPPWSALLPQLGGGAAGTGVGLSVGALKVFAATVLVGTAGLVGVATLGPVVTPSPSQPAKTEPARAVPTVASTASAEVFVEPRAASATRALPEVEPAVSKPFAPRAELVPDAPSASSLQAEAALLKQAKLSQRAGRLEDALAVLDVHARRFPDGQLADGRRRTRIRLLCDLGRTAQARGEAKLLARTSPGDPLAVQALSICTAPIQSERSPEKTGVQP
ncbi:MAG: sigma-70 family RNA polymerase sigma factor [Nannocystaceae bacterium]|nr:sigma-70 family RNA polymerase sigma factor [Nannocystaceae bacterium]